VTAKRLVGLLCGIAFGFWLSWTGFTRYDVILGALTFRDPYLWLMFPTAVGAGFAGLWLLRAAGARTLVGRAPVSWDRIPVRREHLWGSALFGAGWALAGTCPGPAIAQLGQARLAGLFTLGGIFLGVALRGYLTSRSRTPAPITGTCSS
jgi:hypothetical protein